MKSTLALTLVSLALAGAYPAAAQDRYGERPPLVVSPDLSAPWVMQLHRAPRNGQRHVERRSMIPAPDPVVRHVMRGSGDPRMFNRQPVTVQPHHGHMMHQPQRVQSAAMAAGGAARHARPDINPKYLPQTVAYNGPHKPGTIVIDTNENLLYHIEHGGKARRYGVGTGKPGFEWAGTHKVTSKREWPDWRPPAQMIAREKKKGIILPAHMPGGPENPLGARALYLGSTLYRIHGTNQPWTIGNAVSSGCIRMRNEDVIELYGRVKVGTKVIVI